MKDPAEIARRLDELQQKIGIAFRRPALLQEALSHSSFANENPSVSPHDNERLEYLGDAVLQLISAEYLFKARPQAAEGEMTQVRSSMVNTQALAALSEDLGMGEYLLLGKGIARGGGRNLRSLLANAFEAVLGAIFLDQGYDAAYHYCMERFRALPEADVPENFKGRLQHLVQERFGVTPVYDSIGARAQSGRMREYTAVVYAGGDPLGTGHGRTKQLAEQTAAREAIRKLLGEGVAPVAEPAEPAEGVAPVPVAEAEAGVEEAIAVIRATAGEEPLEPPAPAPSAPPPSTAPVQAEPPVDRPPVEEPPPERPGGWRSSREAAAERRRSRADREPVSRAEPAPHKPEPSPVAPEPSPAPPPVQIPGGRQFGAPAAEVEVEVAVSPPEVERLVPAAATSRIPAQQLSVPAAPRQFGQPVAEPPPSPRPRRRAAGTTRTPAAAPPSEATPAGPDADEKPALRRRTSRRTTAPPESGSATEPAQPARRRTSRARKPEVAEPPSASAEPTEAPTPRRRATRRRPAAQEAGSE